MTHSTAPADLGALARLALGVTIVAVMQHVLGTLAFVLVVLVLNTLDPGGLHQMGGPVVHRLVEPLSAIAFVLSGFVAGALLREWSRLGPPWRTIAAASLTSAVVFGAVVALQPINPSWLLASIISVAGSIVIAVVLEYT